MKAPVLTSSLLAALFAIAASATPADATTTKRKKVRAVHAPAGTTYMRYVPPNQQHPHGVYGADGEYLGQDPDPFIRLQIRRDHKPWDNNS